MAVLSIPSQPAAGSINAAYRPIVIKAIVDRMKKTNWKFYRGGTYSLYISSVMPNYSTDPNAIIPNNQTINPGDVFTISDAGALNGTYTVSNVYYHPTYINIDTVEALPPSGYYAGKITIGGTDLFTLVEPPPIVYCDVYMGGLYYKSCSQTQPIETDDATATFQFDIQDAMSEALKPVLPTNGSSLITTILSGNIVENVFCKIRTTTINTSGFTVSDYTAPVQATGRYGPVAGTGFATNEFAVVNATLQHADSQVLSTHLNGFKTRTWDANTFPLSHRPTGYKICNGDSDHFPILTDKTIKCLRIKYKPRGSSEFLTLTNCAVKPETFVIKATALESITGTGFKIVSASDFKVDWGDGVVQSYSAGIRYITHTYSTPYTGNIVILALDLTNITELVSDGFGQITPDEVPLEITTAELSKLDGLTNLFLDTFVTLTGIASELPATLTAIQLPETNLSGDLSELPRDLDYIGIDGENTLEGDIADLPPALTFLLLYGANTIEGDVEDFPASLVNIFIAAGNTVGGDIDGMPSSVLNFFQGSASSTLTGDIAGIPSSMQSINVEANTLSGSIANIPASVVSFIISGSNTISGNLSTLKPAMSRFIIIGSNTVTGDIASIPVIMDTFIVRGNNTISTYTSGRAWPANMNTVVVVPASGGLSSADVDSLLIDLDTGTTWVGDQSIELRGTNAIRTSESDAAVASLILKGVTLNLN